MNLARRGILGASRKIKMTCDGSSDKMVKIYWSMAASKSIFLYRYSKFRR